jgi:nickel-dependent lactate racemase
VTIVVTGASEARQSALRLRLAGRLGDCTLSVHLGTLPPHAAAPPGHPRFAVSGSLSDDEVVERVACALVRMALPRGTLRAKAEDAQKPLSQAAVDELLDELVAGLGAPKSVLLIPPDATRAHSGAGALTAALYRRLAPTADVKVLPALGTHEPMSSDELHRMFPGVPLDRFLVHDFRTTVTQLGEVPGSFVSHVTAGKLDFGVPCQVNREIAGGHWQRIISIGQLVPHEVIGIANHAKNVFVGTGGKESIDRSHFVGAVCGMETMMGRPHTPVRDILNYMSAQLAAQLPITYLCTVRQ